MKKILALVLLVPSLALAAPGTWANITGASRSRTFTCTQAGVTCDAPSAATEGVNLANVGAVTVTACAAAAQTLSGAGTLQAYVYNASAGLWARIPDLDLTTSTASVRCVSFPAIYVPGSYGRVAWVPNAVTASSSSLTVYVNAFSGYANGAPGAPL